jgi:drug/metabolite transporter (DMT)-like permease
MHIVSMVKFLIGAALLVLGIVVLVRSRGQRGFNQTKQAGALMLLAGLLFLAIGLGYLDLKGMLSG